VKWSVKTKDKFYLGIVINDNFKRFESKPSNPL
jgi:hypothetical protein